MSHKHESEKQHDRREGRADETEPPIGGGTPTPPFAESGIPVEKVRVYGDASATYGSMIPPQVIAPYQEEIDELTEPARQEQGKKEDTRKQKEAPPGGPEDKGYRYVDAKDAQAKFVHSDEPPPKLQRFPGEGDTPQRQEEQIHPGLYVEPKNKDDKATEAKGKDVEDERNKKREATEDKPAAKGKHDR